MLANTGPRAARLRVRPLPLSASPDAAIPFLPSLECPVLLDSAADDPHFGRYSILACCPLETLELDRRGLHAEGELLAAPGQSIWEALRRAFACVRLEGPPVERPYAPGWIGYLGYELGRQVERLPGLAPRNPRLPDLRLGFYDALLIHDALQRRWLLVELEFESALRPPGAGRGAAALQDLARRMAEAPVAAAPDPLPAPAALEWDDLSAQAGATPDVTPAQYAQAVRRCIEYIAAGDIFQVNLSQRFTVADAPPPAEIYRCLRRGNPAWYAAYLAFPGEHGETAILSSSPELFLRVRGGRVTTRPIKGTRPRTGEEALDAVRRQQLLDSAKDNAELAMIIDLLRNDLGRVCRYGSVRVTEPRRLETHPTVYHLVGTVEGTLREGVGAAELLRATFPGGSITGAPKIRAMEIIDELEPCARGVYTGCIGIAGVDGNAEWNIAIRTLVCRGNVAYVQAGGGIVADSQPAAEYRETLDKARALLRAVLDARAARRR